MWELDYKEKWVPKNWCYWAVVLEKTLESLLDCKEIQPVNHKRNKSLLFIKRTDAEAEAPVLWPPDAKNWLILKNPDTGKDYRQEEKGMIEDEMAGWHHWLDTQEFEQALGVGEGQGGLVCCSPWDHKQSDKTEWLNWSDGTYHLPWASQVVLVVKKLSTSLKDIRDTSLIPGLGRSPGGGHNNPLHILAGESHGQTTLGGYNL